MFWQRLVVLFVNSSQLHQGVTFNFITLRSTFFYNILIIPCTMQFCRPYWQTILLNLMTLLYPFSFITFLLLLVSSSSVDLMLERLCLEGSQIQAKYAVHALAAITKDDGLKSLSVLYKVYLNYLLQDNYADLQLVLITCKPFLFEKLHLPPGLCHF